MARRTEDGARPRPALQTTGEAKAEVLAAFRKQMKLIDILKRQKVHMEAARLLNFTEEGCMRVVNWDDSAGLPVDTAARNPGGEEAGGSVCPLSTRL